MYRNELFTVVALPDLVRDRLSMLLCFNTGKGKVQAPQNPTINVDSLHN